MSRSSRFPPTRARAIERVRQQLLRESFPRLQMMFIVAVTGGVGLLASFSMLRLGLESMALRYPLALVVAYGVFMLLLWLWRSAWRWRRCTSSTSRPCSLPKCWSTVP